MMKQEAPAASVLELMGQVFCWWKSPLLGPLSPMPLMVRAALPVLVSVTVFAGLVVLTWWFPKLKLVGLRLATGADELVPEPLNATVCGLPAALSATDRLALKLPSAVGAKVTLMVQ